MRGTNGNLRQPFIRQRQTPDGLSCYLRDITSRKIADKEFAGLERLSLVGQLASGVGHEIRNPMTTVRGYLQLLGQDLKGFNSGFLEYS